MPCSVISAAPIGIITLTGQYWMPHSVNERSPTEIASEANLYEVTSIVTMLWTGARFAMDSVNFGEHSFTEWGVQYWPVKPTIPIGALLLTLQGISKLVKDIMIVREESA